MSTIGAATAPVSREPVSEPVARAAADAERVEALQRSLIGAAAPSSLLWPKRANPPRQIDLFDFDIENTTLPAAARELAFAAHHRRRLRVVFANAHVVNTAHDDAAYHAVVASADRIYADGSGMALAARIVGRPLIDNVNGTDLFPLLCREAIDAGVSIFLLGGKPGVAAQAAATIDAFGLGAAIAGTHHGYFAKGTPAEDDVLAAIEASGASILLVGFGVPLQDQWLARHAGRLGVPVVAGVGGLFDFFAGAVDRSPKVMRTIGCEWMWRLAMEPRRMARRYLVGNAVFIARAMAERRRKRAGLAR